MAIKIITDSSSDLTTEQANKYGIRVLPLLVYVDDVEYRDNIDISADQLMEAMLNGKKTHTGQIPPAELFELYEELAETNDSYLYFPISSELSGSYATTVSTLAQFKEDHPNFQMTVIDTRCVSQGLGQMLIELSELIKTGISEQKALDYIEKRRKNIEHIFTVDKLDWLLAGGRVSKSQAVVGNLLNIKPILHIEDGKLIPFDKARGNKKKLQAIKNYIETKAINLEGKIVPITHANNLKEAELIKDYLIEEHKVKEVIIADLGSVIAAHCGPGLLCVFFEGKENVFN